MSLRQYLNVCYTAIVSGMDTAERKKIDMLLAGKQEKDVLAAQNREALQSLLPFMGQVN